MFFITIYIRNCTDASSAFLMQVQYNAEFDLNILQCKSFFIFLVVDTKTKMAYSLIANYDYNFLLFFFVSNTKYTIDKKMFCQH